MHGLTIADICELVFDYTSACVSRVMRIRVSEDDEDDEDIPKVSYTCLYFCFY